MSCSPRLIKGALRTLWGEIQTQNFYIYNITEIKYIFQNCINKLFSDKNKILGKLFDVREVAGSAKYKQHKKKCCPLKVGVFIQSLLVHMTISQWGSFFSDGILFSKTTKCTFKTINLILFVFIVPTLLTLTQVWHWTDYHKHKSKVKLS